MNVPNGDCVVSAGLQWKNRKIDKIVTLYQIELCKNLARLGTLCTQSVNEGLTNALQWGGWWYCYKYQLCHKLGKAGENNRLTPTISLVVMGQDARG
jgi:hypothetical protein